jgi:dipeptidyl aminopeptidase/acylaminoacyl peptidase
VLVISSLAGVAAQPSAPVQPPPTEIFLAPLEIAGEAIRVGTPVNITKHPGYDNQPFFTLDGTAILFTSDRGGRQTDIHRYDLATREIAQLTKTPESEYSPTMAPDGESFSVIRVEADETQRLWKFPLDGGQPSLVLTDVKPVGYHAWADAQTLVLFILGDPPTLQVADVTTGKAEIVAQRPGRAIARTPAGAISFVRKGPDKEPWEIVELDVQSRKLTAIAATLPDREDYAWLPDGGLLMGSGAKLFFRSTGDAADWTEIADLADAGLTNITRLAVSPDGRRLAIVAEIPGR